MKKLFLLTTVLLFGMTACQKTEMSDATSGNTQITVKASFPAQMAETRAAGDGTTVDRCIMQIYLDGELYGERQVAAVENLSATFSVRLVAGKTFDLVFWADKSGADINTDLHYNTADLANVAFTGDYIGNDDARDAFFGTAQVISDKSQAVNVELKRPFGQLNVKTLDLAEVKAAAPALEPKKVKIEFASVPTGINLLTGELTDAKSAVAYADAAAVVDAEGHLSFDYVLAPAGTEQFLADFTMSFLDENGAEVAGAYDFSSIPVQRNYRTNVSGNLLTKKADINVEVKPGFDGDIDKTITEVSSLKDLNLFLNAGGNAKLMADLTVSNMSMFMPFKDADLDLNGHTLTFENQNGTTCGYKIYTDTSIRNGKIVAKMDSNVDAAIVCGTGNSLTLDGVEFESEASCVGPVTQASNCTITIKNSTLKCGTYAVSTSANTPVGENLKITIENSTLEGSTAILVNVPCELTIDKCEITAIMQALLLRGGTANVSNSTLTFNTTDSFSNQEEAESFANYFETANWGSGNMVNLAAVTVGNKLEGSYQYPTVLNMVNTTVQTVGTYASLFPAMYVHANQGEGLGVTITYDDQCTFTGDMTYGSSNIIVNGEAK